MFTSRKIKYFISTPFGYITPKNKEMKDKSISDIYGEYKDFGYWMVMLNPRKSKGSLTSGKWMLFVEHKDLDNCLEVLLKGIDSGVFHNIKCSIPNENNPHNVPGIAAIMVYTDDYSDTQDVARVLKYLMENGLNYGKDIEYKADYQTRQGKYEGGRGESWLYCSKDFQFE